MGGPPRFEVDSDLATFLEGPVAMVVATSDAKRRPHTVRGYAAKMSADRKHITVHVPTIQSAAVLADVAETSRVAVVFSRVRDYVTYQLKGHDAAIGELEPDAPSRLAAYTEAFFTELIRVGVTRDTVSGFNFANVTALTFTPSQCFVQTPGPHAGERMGAEHE